MTKLQILNSYLTERLMVTVQEILEIVKETVSEYQEENARTKRENENLRRRLQEFGLGSESHFWGAHPAALAVSGGKPLIEQQHSEQEWSSSLQSDTELTLTEEKQEITEKHIVGQREEEPVLSSCVERDDSINPIPPVNPTETGNSEGIIEQQMTILREETHSGRQSVHTDETDTSIVSPGLKKLALEITLSMVSPSSVNPGINSVQNSDVSLTVPVNTELNCQPGLRSDQIKTEPDEVDLTSGQLSELGYSPKTHYSINKTVGETSAITAYDNGAEARHMPPCDTLAGEVQSESFLAEHRQERQHSCLQCGKCFCRVSYMKIHQQIHTGKRPYSCAWCSKSFIQSGDLRRHERIHTGDKPHQCLWCEKSFTQVGNLRRHQRIHTGERPYCCTRCGKTFYDGGALKNHKRVHLQERKQRNIHMQND